MIVKNQQNRKQKFDLRCPECGMNLDDPRAEGFVKESETFCCKGCASETGCTCKKIRGVRPEIGNRKRTMGEKVLNGKRPAPAAEKKAKPAKIASRTLINGKSVPMKPLSGNRDSTRVQARGQSEQRGKMTQRPNTKAGVDRTSRTGSKG